MSGALAYEAGCFAQTLEGPKPEVLDLMDRLYLDPRHTAVEIIEARRVDCRLYRDFGMCLMDRERARSLLHFT